MKTGRLFLIPAVILLSCNFAWPEHPKSVILLIGDGMGFEQLKAAGMYLHGSSGTLSFESLPHKGAVTTCSADSPVTDSAAAATAIATGYKVNNGVISMSFPGSGRELQTMLEYFKGKGKSAGLVTTKNLNDATPAGFGAHEPDRNNLEQISRDYLYGSKPDVLLGGGGSGLTPASASLAGYTVVSDTSGLFSIDTETCTLACGLFGSAAMPYEYDGMESYPHLSGMTRTALDILDNDPDGFFVMIEGGKIDSAGHSNDLARNIFETVEFSSSVQAALDWLNQKADTHTLLVVTADHETGGLNVTANNGKGNLPSVTWATTGHTSANVPVFATGAGAELFNAVINNTSFFAFCTGFQP